MDRDQLARNCADGAANWLVENHHQHSPIGKRARLYSLYYDAIYAAILNYQTVSNALNIRAIAMASEN